MGDSIARNKIYNECVIACIDASLVEQKFLFFYFSFKFHQSSDVDHSFACFFFGLFENE